MEKKIEIKFTPLKITALAVSGTMALLTLIMHCLQFGGSAANVVYVLFSMIFSIALSFSLGLIIWLLSNVLESKQGTKTAGEKVKSEKTETKPEATKE